MRTRRRKRSRFGRAAVIVLLFIIITVAAQKFNIWQELNGNGNVNSGYISPEVSDKLAEFAWEHHLQGNEWPQELIELLDKNPDAEEFVLNYPLKKDTNFVIDLSEYQNCDTVPLFLQWDERWGYSEYGEELMELSGCGPTCLSMVCVYLLNDTEYNPRYIADYSEANGYCVPGSGSAWTLISEGGRKLGLDVEELSLDEEEIVRNLGAGNPIICVMGPGDFTTSGHFIVMTDYIDGQIKVNDPNSKIRSAKLWDYEDIKSQIRNLWVCMLE